MNTDELEEEIKKICKNSEKLGFIKAHDLFMEQDKRIKNLILSEFPRNLIQNSYAQGVLDTLAGIEKALNEGLLKMR
jgi:hypothetical protein